jgi:hypothetical protein
MSRQLQDFDGYENDLVKVLRRAVGDEVPNYAGKQAFWVVQCKSCGKIRVQRGTRIKERQACSGCRGKKLSACRDQKLRAQALTAWSQIEAATVARNLDGVEAAVNTLRKYERLISRE